MQLGRRFKARIAVDKVLEVYKKDIALLTEYFKKVHGLNHEEAKMLNTYGTLLLTDLFKEGKIILRDESS